MAMQYAVKRGDYFSFRIKIPSDLHQYFSSPVLQVALGTDDKKEAKKLIAGWYSKVSGIFQSLRNEFLSEEVKRELVHSSVCPKKKKTAKTQIRRLSHLIEEYTKENLSNWRPKSKQEVDFSLWLFKEVVGDIPVSHLNRDTIKNFRDTISKLPPNFTKSPRFRDLTIKQILKLSDLPTPMSPKSVNKHLGWVNSLLTFAVRERYIPINFAEGLNVKDSRRADEERKAYSKEDLQKIVNHLEWNEERPERYWIPLLAMFQGARGNEICSLYVQDIVTIDGVPCLDINDNRYIASETVDKYVKNRSSLRVVPIHPTILKLGFLDYVEKKKKSGRKRLFEGLKLYRDGYYHDFGKWYQTFNREHITDDPGKVFHSLRHSFVDYFKQRRDDKKLREALVGHKSGESMTDDRYGKAFHPKIMLDLLKTLDYGVDLTPVMQNHFKPWTPEEEGRPSRPLIID